MTTTHYLLSHQNLLAWLGTMLADGKDLIAPRKIKDKLFFSKVDSIDQIAFDVQPTAESAKSVLFPRVEQLLSYERTNEGIRVHDPASTVPGERVVFGTKPCDAAGFERLAAFFASEIPDALVDQRRKALTVVSMSCARADGDCFCTSVGGGPGDTTGSDILLTAVDGERYLVECLTDRGAGLLDGHKSLLETADRIDKSRFLANVEPVGPMESLHQRLSPSFNDPFWAEASLRCLGCGACAYVCPVCSCFDIEDEGTAAQGDRLRCWDSCGFALFTMHTSGHNPRPDQSSRWRQRILHKFAYEPERLGFPGCVGCGRCSRGCPVDMNLKEQLQETATRLAAGGAQ